MKKSNDAFYFPHDCKLADCQDILFLKNDLGMEGYGIFWSLLELLTQQPGYKCPMSLAPILAKRLETEEVKILAVIKNYNLFEFDKNNNFSSVYLNGKMVKVNQIAKKRREAGLASAKKRVEIKTIASSASVQQMFNTCSTNAEQVLDKCSTIKEKKIKEKEIKENIFIKPSLIEIEDYCRHRSNKIDPEKFFNHYQSRGWCMGKNNTPMSDWKAAIHNWEKNEVNEVKADLGVEEWINESGNRTYGKSGVIVPNEAPPRPSRKHIWSIHDKGWRVIL
ncbi:MAG: DUF4373 domain-containing protein [Gudongella sp.]|jgi:hypothetical protein|nr:DUF4373 domain-containing protein [Gudongella sp.]